MKQARLDKEKQKFLLRKKDIARRLNEINSSRQNSSRPLRSGSVAEGAPIRLDNEEYYDEEDESYEDEVDELDEEELDKTVG